MSGPPDRTGSPSETVGRNAISGLIALVVFVVIAALTGGGIAFIVIGGIVVFVVTTLVALAIGSMMRGRRAG